ncbi:3-deoxy-manno-octulosonate cytidylyltransferase [Spongorhabdus nitratireducens]
MSYSVIIPARFGSSRLPGKPLMDIAGKPMVQHVWERACESAAERVVIATDDERIMRAAEGFGAEAVLTLASHPSGTDRLHEVVTKLGLADDEIVVNVQGDEPLIPAKIIDQVAGNLRQHEQASVATLCEPIHDARDVFDPHIVKVITDRDGHAMYFSRAAMPWARDAFAVERENLPESHLFQRHIGLYAYRVGLLKEYVTWGTCPLEELESLEQLRVLWNGHRIHVDVALEAPAAGVDTQSDLESVRRLVEARDALA